MAAEQTKSSEAQAGIPLPEFEAAVDTLDQLRRTGKFQIFLAREHSIRFVGETDEFRVAFGKRLGVDLVEKKKAQDCMEELQTYLQVVVATSKAETAVRIFEEQVYDDEFRSAQADPSRSAVLRKIIEAKVALITTKLVSASMRDRARRLATAIGAVVEDMDIEIISKRKSLTQGGEIETPYLRIRMRYTTSGGSRIFFAIPPWLTGAPREFSSLELECDENDIDLLISRLVQAKDLLSTAIDAKLKLEQADIKTT